MLRLACALALAALYFASAHATAGALFTTMCNGTVVNANVQYPTKYHVYLNGGPQNCGGAAGLTDGWYFFQITEPAGKVLLSTDSILARQVRVSGGYFVEYSNRDCTTGWPASGSRPAIPAASAEQCVLHQLCPGKCPNTVTVQMMPYLDTPNPGGEYKAWVVPIGDYAGVDTDNFGFVNAPAKTDNYKARSPETTAPPTTAPPTVPVSAPPVPPPTEPVLPPRTSQPPVVVESAQPTEPVATPAPTAPEETERPVEPEQPVQTLPLIPPPPVDTTAAPPRDTTEAPVIAEFGGQPAPAPSASHSGLSKAAIAGIVVAGVAMVVAAALLGVFLVAKSGASVGGVAFSNGMHGASHDNPIHAVPYKMFDNPLSA